MRMVGPQSLSGRFGEMQISYPSRDLINPSPSTPQPIIYADYAPGRKRQTAFERCHIFMSPLYSHPRHNDVSVNNGTMYDDGHLRLQYYNK
jgi:hypothetical protein